MKTNRVPTGSRLKKEPRSKSLIVQIRPSKIEVETFKYESLKIDSFWDELIK